MKTYDVTIKEKDGPLLWCETIIRVDCENNEHPSKKAIDFVCEYGYGRVRELQIITKIQRIL